MKKILGLFFLGFFMQAVNAGMELDALRYCENVIMESNDELSPEYKLTEKMTSSAFRSTLKDGSYQIIEGCSEALTSQCNLSNDPAKPNKCILYAVMVNHKVDDFRACCVFENH